MGYSITVKNIPDDLYESLRQAAGMHHRSINSEIIACLERAFHPVKLTVEERLARVDRIHRKLTGKRFPAKEVQAAIRRGRP